MDDSDQMVVEHAKETLLQYGEEIISELEVLEEDCFMSINQTQNILAVLSELRFQKVKRALSNWLKSEDKNLLEAAYIISTYQFPELKIEDFTRPFQELKHQCWMEINIRQTSFEKVNVLNKIFFKNQEFVKVKKTPYSPFEIFVNSVMDTREGTNLSLGLIYSIVAQSLDIPIYGVTTMNNRPPFVLAYLDEDNLLPILNWGIDNNGVLFYISIDEKGLIVDPQQLKEAFISGGLPQDRAQFEPSPNSLIIKKYLNDIKRSYENQIQFRYKLKDMEELLELFS